MFQWNELILSIPISWFSYKYYNCREDGGYSQCIKNDAKWLWARIPNFSENLASSFPLAFCDVIFEPWIERLHQGNPIAKSVARDAIKIPSNIYTCYNENKIGHTDIKYDVGNIWASSLTTLCKTSIISSYAISHPNSNWETASRSANYICEPINRGFSLISRNKQEEKSTDDITYFEFAQTNLNSNLALKAIGEGVTKAFVADQIGKIIAELGIVTFLKSSYISIENHYVNWAFNAPSQALLYNRVMVIHQTQIYNQPLKLLGMISIIAMDLAFKTMAELITSYLIVPGVRVAHDIVGNHIEQHLTKIFHPVSQNNYELDYAVDQMDLQDDFPPYVGE